MSLYIRYVPTVLGGGGGSSGVTSVGLADGSTTPIYGISGSPVTSTGTLTFTLANQNANLVFAGPSTGAAAQPGFRAIVAADLPTGNLSTASANLAIGSGTGAVIGSGTTITLTEGNLSTASANLTIGSGTNAVLGAGTTITLTEGNLSTASANLAIGNGTNAVLGSGTTLTLTEGNLTETTSAVLTIIGGTNAVLGSGTTIQVKQSSGSQSGYLSSTDWTTFNGKQAAGNYITALTGDGTASGPGSVALTLATVNANVGSFSPAAVTVNAKGLVTAASNVTTGNLTDTGTDGITVTGGTGAVLGSGTSISQHVADSTHNGYLSSTDWSTFNGKGTGSVTSVTFTGDGTVLSSTPSSAVTTSGTLTASLNTQTKNTFLAGPTSGSAAAPTFRAINSADLPTAAFVAPTIQTFTTGSGTYTPPSSPRTPLYICVEIVGAGGGGGASGGVSGSNPTAGGTGGDTTFSTLTAHGGVGGNPSPGPNQTGGSGGTASGGDLNITGGNGGGNTAGVNSSINGGNGGSSYFGFGGPYNPGNQANTFAGNVATGYGAGGGGASNNASSTGGCGGGGGAYVRKIFSSPSSVSYSVGAHGAGGTAGTGGNNGGNGTDGIIIVTEFYQ